MLKTLEELITIIRQRKESSIEESYTKKLLYTNGYKHISTDYIVFIPPKLKYITFLDKHLKWLPLGAQYYISAVKETHN